MTPENLNNLRHTLAHILAQAVQESFQGVQLGIGPTTQHGFYYDFDNATITAEHLKTLEEKMKEIVKRNLEMKHEQWDIQKAYDYFSQKNEPYKLDLINELKNNGETKVGIAFTGDEFVDLCKGGHIQNTQHIKTNAFQITHTAGAYWRGDENNQMLTRVYGVAFENKEQLKAHNQKIADAKERDHRKLGAELDLFTFSPMVGAGLPLFTPKGTAMRESLLLFLWELSQQYGYEKVTIPHITKLELYETSGHADKFKDEFFYVKGAQSKQEFVLKPMNCPHHAQIYLAKPRSWKELPIRYTETTVQYRDEKPGELLGLSRVRAFNVDDAHLFCRPQDIKQEVSNIVKIIESFYSVLGMYKQGESFKVSLSVRDSANLEKYLGSDENWNLAEQYLEDVAQEHNLNATRMEGEAAFYGPKLDFMFEDALGREWQLATAQIDFVQPQRFGLAYADQNGTKQTPVMIHRAISGSLERFMSVLIEHFGGRFPLWLSPVHAFILPISEKYNEYARSIHAQLQNNNIRSQVQDQDENLGKKIRIGETQKIPYLIVVGEKEQNDQTISVRVTHHGKNTQSTTLQEFITQTTQLIHNRSNEYS